MDIDRDRQQITTSNFTFVLKQMVEYFISPIKAVSAFYSMIFGWNNESVIQFSKKSLDSASRNGEVILNLNPTKKQNLKNLLKNIIFI